MVCSTIIVRATDVLPFTASVDDEQTKQTSKEHKQQAEQIFRRITPNSEPRCSVESGQYALHYLLADNVVFLTIADKSYPRKLAFSYLEELSTEFFMSYGSKVESTFIDDPSKDTFILKTARSYQATRAASSAGSSSLDKLNDELQDTVQIMTEIAQGLLGRNSSDEMSRLATSLRSDSEKYRKATRNVNAQAMILVAVLFVILVWWRFS